MSLFNHRKNADKKGDYSGKKNDLYLNKSSKDFYSRIIDSYVSQNNKSTKATTPKTPRYTEKMIYQKIHVLGSFLQQGFAGVG